MDEKIEKYLAERLSDTHFFDFHSPQPKLHKYFEDIHFFDCSYTMIVNYEDKSFPVKPTEGYSIHKNHQSGKELPFCCSYHTEIYNEALKWTIKFLADPLDNILANKIISQLSYTEHLIKHSLDNKDSGVDEDNWYGTIFEYIEYNVASFGINATGLDFYLDKLKKFVEEIGQRFSPDQKQHLMSYISNAGRIYQHNKNGYLEILDSYEEILDKWLHIFPFDLGGDVLDKYKQNMGYGFTLPPMKKNKYGIHLSFITDLKERFHKNLEKLTNNLLSAVSSVYLLEKGLIDDLKKKQLSLLIEQRKLKLKSGYGTPEDKELYVHVLEQWFNDEKEFINELDSLTKGLIPEQRDISEPQVPIGHNFSSRLLAFSNKKILKNIYDSLKGYFPGNEDELKSALEGNKLDQPIVFPYSQNKLVEVFRRLKYNGFIPNKSSEIRDWLCANFHFRFKRGKTEEIRPLNPDSVWDILSKGRGEPTKRERICFEGIEWLPYKSPLTLERESESEQF